MNSPKDSKLSDKAKEIAEKYKFKFLNTLNERQLRVKCKELLKALIELEIDYDIQHQKLVHTEKLVVDENNSASIYKDYNNRWNGIDKIIFILKKHNKIMLSQEIETVLVSLEPELKLKWKNTFSSVTSYIYRAIKFNRVIQCHKIGNYGFTYALPEWIDDNNLLKKKYLI